jgi:hypothetical protein
MFYQKKFSLSKINIVFGSAFVCLLFLTTLVGCDKDSIVSSTKGSSMFVQDRTTPTVTYGMLNFSSFEELATFTRSLQDREDDTTVVKNAYATLGIDVNAETIPNLTDHPICLIMENAIGGYTSARKAEENVINAALNLGDSSINSIVIFPYWKTALNADKAVHVGNRIYKYYENGGIAIVLNDDWALYAAIYNQPFESLRESFNLIVTSDAREGWDQYFTFNSDQSIHTAKQIFIPRFVAEKAAGGNLAVVNLSLLESAAGTSTFTWLYADHTTSTGKTPNRTINPAETLGVIINNGCGRRDTLSVSDRILACSVDNFTITYLSNNQIRFELPGYNPSTSEYNLKWTFSDGSTSTSNPVTKTFTSNGTVTCSFYYKINGSLACAFTKPYFAKCGDKKTQSGTFVFDQGNQRWKLDGAIWVQTGEVGCKVKYLRWRGAILKWQPANNQGACANISGTYIREVYNPNKNCLTITASGSHCLGEGTFPTTVSFTIPEVPNVFVNPGALSAGLGIQVSGTWRGWGYAGKPRLVLP